MWKLNLSNLASSSMKNGIKDRSTARPHCLQKTKKHETFYVILRSQNTFWLCCKLILSVISIKNSVNLRKRFVCGWITCKLYTIDQSKYCCHITDIRFMKKNLWNYTWYVWKYIYMNYVNKDIPCFANNINICLSQKFSYFDKS